MKNKDKLLKEINQFLMQHFKGSRYFSLVYGSHASGTHSLESDIDLFVVAESSTLFDLNKIKKFVIDLHKINKIKIDNEVPFENKLLINYPEAEEAARLKGFIIRSGKVIIPPVVKTKKFLGSKEIRSRLLINALTTPHIYLGRDYRSYKNTKDIAERGITLLAMSNLNQKRFKVAEVIKFLLMGKHGEEEEMYLGYKRHRSVVKYLHNLVAKNLKNLEREGSMRLEATDEYSCVGISNLLNAFSSAKIMSQKSKMME